MHINCMYCLYNPYQVHLTPSIKTHWWKIRRTGNLAFKRSVRRRVLSSKLNYNKIMLLQTKLLLLYLSSLIQHMQWNHFLNLVFWDINDLHGVVFPLIKSVSQKLYFSGSLMFLPIDFKWIFTGRHWLRYYSRITSL